MEMENKIEIEKTKTVNKTDIIKENEELSSKEKYNIILKLYKGLSENLEDLYVKSKDKNGSTKASQIAYKIDRIASGLHYMLDFDNDKTKKISENFRELYRHIRFAMKLVYEKQEYKLINSSREIAKTLYESWAKIKPSI